MIAVKDIWKVAHEQTLLPETHIEITYSVTEPGLQEDATSTANNEEPFSEAERLVANWAKKGNKYATLEYGMWGLDGSFDYFNNPPTAPGYVTNVYSRKYGSFSTNTAPKITINFSEVHTEPIPGITITWSESHNEHAVEFMVSAYNDDTLITSRHVYYNKDAVSLVWMEDLAGFNKVEIIVYEWCLPYHRARVSDVYMGIKTVYTKNDLLGFTHKQNLDLLSAELPKNEITFKLRNENTQWNPDNPEGVNKYLLERQEIVVRYGMTVGNTIEWIKGGSFWLSEWNVPANGLEASFTASDALSLMNETYTGRTSGVLYNIATDAFEQANLPTMGGGGKRYSVDASLLDYEADFSGEYTIADVLQLVAHAGNCIFYSDRNGIVRIEPRNKAVTDYVITQSVSYAHPEYEISKPLKAVSVTYGSDGSTVTYGAGSSGEVQSVDNEFIKTEADALRVAEATANLLTHRKTISGEFRADPRMDAGDVITVKSRYATNTVAVTEIEYSTTGGAFRGKYTGRVLTSEEV